MKPTSGTKARCVDWSIIVSLSAPICSALRFIFQVLSQIPVSDVLIGRAHVDVGFALRLLNLEPVLSKGHSP